MGSSARHGKAQNKPIYTAKLSKMRGFEASLPLQQRKEKNENFKRCLLIQFSKRQLEFQVQLGCLSEGIFFFDDCIMFHCVYIQISFICVLDDPCLGYCEQCCHKYRHVNIPINTPISIPLNT